MRVRRRVREVARDLGKRQTIGRPVKRPRLGVAPLLRESRVVDRRSLEAGRGAGFEPPQREPGIAHRAREGARGGPPPPAPALSPKAAGGPPPGEGPRRGDHPPPRGPPPPPLPP